MKYWITMYPYAIQNGEIEVPDDVAENGDVKNWIRNNLDKAEFEPIDLDYAGTDFDYEEGVD